MIQFPKRRHASLPLSSTVQITSNKNKKNQKQGIGRFLVSLTILESKPGSGGAHLVILAGGRGRWISEFKASLIYKS